MSGQYERFRVSDDLVGTLKSKEVRRFYEKQNAILVSTFLPTFPGCTFFMFYHVVGDLTIH
jgi:hypothetical protein